MLRDRKSNMTIHGCMDSQLKESVPLGTGSITQLAILALGVNSDFLDVNV